MNTTTIAGNPVHAIALLPGDVIHRVPHVIHGTDMRGHEWQRYIDCADDYPSVDRVRTEGPDLAAVYWHLGAATGVTVYGRTGLVPLVRRAA